MIPRISGAEGAELITQPELEPEQEPKVHFWPN